MTPGVVVRLIAVMGLWALCFPLISIGLDLAPHLMFAAMRAALAGLSLLAIGLALHRPWPRGRLAWTWIAVLGFGSTSLGFLGMFHGAESVAPGVATVVASAQPLLTAVLAALVLRERLGLVAMFGLALGFAGVIAISWPGLTSSARESYLQGLGYIGIASFGAAIGNVAMKRLSMSVEPLQATGFSLVLGAAPLAVWSALTERASLSVMLSVKFMLVLVALSILVTALAAWLWFSVLKRVELSRANAFAFLTPLFGLAIGVSFFGERLAPVQFFGVVLTAAGVALAQHKGPPIRPIDNDRDGVLNSG